MGEAFDKTAKLLGLPYPGGPNVEAARRARQCQAPMHLPRPLLDGLRRRMDFSFSGLKTAVRQLAQNAALNVDDACASFQAAVIDILCDRTAQALALFRAGFSGALGRPWWWPAASPPIRPIGAALDAAGGKPGFRHPHSAAQTLHRQCGDDRLGGAGAVRAGAARPARCQPAGALAAGWPSRRRWRSAPGWR